MRSMAAATSSRSILRAVSTTFTWSAASAASNSVWSIGKSGCVEAGSPGGTPPAPARLRGGRLGGGAAPGRAGAPVLLARGCLKLGEALEPERLREAHDRRGGGV